MRKKKRCWQGRLRRDGKWKECGFLQSQRKAFSKKEETASLVVVFFLQQPSKRSPCFHPCHLFRLYLNTAAKVILLKRKPDHVIPLLKSLQHGLGPPTVKVKALSRDCRPYMLWSQSPCLTSCPLLSTLAALVSILFLFLCKEQLYGDLIHISCNFPI